DMRIVLPGAPSRASRSLDGVESHLSVIEHKRRTALNKQRLERCDGFVARGSRGHVATGLDVEVVFVAARKVIRASPLLDGRRRGCSAASRAFNERGSSITRPPT